MANLKRLRRWVFAVLILNAIGALILWMTGSFASSGDLMIESPYFSRDYRTARDRFRQAAEAKGARLESLLLTARGPAGEDLTIDIAWFGTESPRRVLLHSSGLHGVEAFAGSAIQLRLLEDLPAIPDDTALVFAHVLNPFGMTWLRRFNENNVDLNRNFLASGEKYEGRPEGYVDLYDFLNPTSLPRIETFTAKAAWLILRHGRPTLEEAVVTGQYDYPEGLFFGGNEPEEGAALYQDFLARRLGGAERVFAIDIHTGLGPFGEDTVLVSEEAHPRLRELLGDRVEAFSTAADNVAYRIRGGLHEMVPRVLEGAEVDFVGQEFGTYGSVRVLHSLRNENFGYHHDRDARETACKGHLRDTFYPDNEEWGRKVLARGRELFDSVLEILVRN